jgi:hypothetical protein
LIIMSIIFDLFWLAQFKSAPAILLPSFVLRAGLTALLATFVMLDRASCLIGPTGLAASMGRRW